MKPRNLVIFFALAQFCVALLTDSDTFTHEESMWHYIGRNWFRFGMTPYEGGVDNKSPLIFAVFGLSDSLFGIDFWFPRVLGVIVEALGLLYLYKIAIKLSANPQAATFAASIYGFSLLWRATGGKYVSFTETYAIALMIMAVYYYLVAERRKQFFVSGLLAGFALGWRLTAIFSTLAISEHALFKKRNTLIPFFAGIITSIVALLMIASIPGIQLSDLYRYMLSENTGSGSTTDHPFSWQVQSFFEAFFYSEMLLFYPLLAAWFFMRERISLLTIWLACEFIGIIVLGIFARPHLKALLPSLSLISGITLAQFIQHYSISFDKMLIAVWLIFFPKITEPIIALKRSITGQKPPIEIKVDDESIPRPNEQMEKELGLWIKSITEPNDKVLVAGFGARVQLFSERISPTIYFNATQTPRAKQVFMQQVLADKPEIIATPIFPGYKQYVSEDIRNFIDSLTAADYHYVNMRYGYAVFGKNEQ